MAGFVLVLFWSISYLYRAPDFNHDLLSITRDSTIIKLKRAGQIRQPNPSSFNMEVALVGCDDQCALNGLPLPWLSMGVFNSVTDITRSFILKNFCLIGAAGYIAPRHMKAIKDTGSRLVAALDTNDSVGIIDSYFPDADFFTEFERLDRHIDKLRRAHHEKAVDYISICSPNYLHDSHARFAIRSGAEAICEKPVVLNPWNIDGLRALEQDTGRKINTILQLRLHPTILSLRDRVASSTTQHKYDVDLTYITSRGRWYLQSWKGDEKKSGGIATNIGVHFYDMLHFVFGRVDKNVVHHYSATKAGGYIEYQRARVRWFLSIDYEDLPQSVKASGERTFRSITCDGEEVEFSGGFGDLHTRSYEQILSGNGFGLEENRVAIETVSDIRRAEPIGLINDYHPFLRGARD